MSYEHFFYNFEINHNNFGLVILLIVLSFGVVYAK